MVCAVCDESWFVPAAVPVENLVKVNSERKSSDRPVTSDDHGDLGDDRLFEDEVEEEADDDQVADGDTLQALRATGNGDDPLAEIEGDEDGDPRDDSFIDQVKSRGRDFVVEKDERADDDAPEFSENDDELSTEDLAFVDADFEDLDEENQKERGFGRRARAERRRSTALTTLEDGAQSADEIFNDEFFKTHRVQPKDLEKALRKARRRAESREKNRLTPFRVASWMIWIGVVVATAFTAYTYRLDIVNAWPNATVAYAAIGIDAEPDGLKIEAAGHRLAMSTSGPVIEIHGWVTNNSPASVPAPQMIAEALAADGEILSRWSFDLNVGEIDGDGRVNFNTRNAAPKGVAEIVLTFANDEVQPTN